MYTKASHSLTLNEPIKHVSLYLNVKSFKVIIIVFIKYLSNLLFENMFLV